MTTSIFSVENKVALVTGGTSGIGYMIAQGLVKHGAKVYVASRKAEACEKTAKELSEMGVNLEGVGKERLQKIVKDPEFLDRIFKAGGGIVKLAGDDSGPPPKSGPTPHGLPYVAKNVRPIKERK